MTNKGRQYIRRNLPPPSTPVANLWLRAWFAVTLGHLLIISFQFVRTDGHTD